MAGTKPRKGRIPKGSASPTAGSSPISDIYREMLAEVVSSSPTRFSEEGKAVKRRRIGGKVISRHDGGTSGHDTEQSSVLAEDTDSDNHISEKAIPRQQTAYNDSDDSPESDMDWEEVGLRKDGVEETAEEDVEDEKPMELVLDTGDVRSPRRGTARRKPSTAIEKKMRLEVHKTHLLCLLAHVHLRNNWCDDVEVQAALKGLLTKRNVSYLNPDDEKSQFQRSRSFMDGLAQASDAWRTKFKVTARGLRRPYWVEPVEALKDFTLPDDMDLPLEKPDFRALAGKLEGSRDIGAQLFCALLRSVGVEARLVCSLQSLPFTAAVKNTTPQKPKPDIIVAELNNLPATSDEDSGVDVQHHVAPFGPTSSSTIDGMAPLVPRRPRRLGQPTFALGSDDNLGKPPPTKKPKRKRIKESPYPVVWVEAFNTAVQKWVPVDSLVTNTIAKPSKLEPPASDAENNMSYVVAFEEDGAAQDVTRRYAKAYNAKSRKSRVEVTKGGERWWRRTMRVFRRGWDLDRDQVEDAELTAKEAAEEMPRSVQDFKDHPYYALERHLKRSEVLHPKREVGKVGAGKSLSGGATKALEPIYRRRDVHHVKSADGWYRLGREIKAGEQPLKRVQPRRQRAISVNEDGEEEADDDRGAGTGVYAGFQTVPYEAPPIVNGRVPKNTYGNLDVYVPSMVPRGGVHLPYPEAARAAKVVGVDYADAVTGFEFKGRHGTAVIKGIVAAVEYREALEEVIEGFQNERAQAEEARRTLEALRMWRRFMAGLRVRERIDGYDVEGERDAVQEGMGKVDEEMEEGDGGGFLPDRDQEEVAEPTVGRFYFQQNLSSEDEGRGFRSRYVDEDADAEEALRSIEASPETHQADTAYALPLSQTEGGGFIIEKGLHESGGFIPEKVEETTEVFSQGKSDTDNLDVGQGLADVELAEGIILQRLHEEGDFVPNGNGVGGGFITENDPEQATSGAPERVDKDMSQASVDQDKDAAKESNLGTNSNNVLEGNHLSEGGNDEEDRGSLLSHDPEDEDADPEWLASDQE